MPTAFPLPTWWMFFRDLLLNEQESMYERYAALFALRNDGGDAAVSAIVAALSVKSALLRHEVSSLANPCCHFFIQS
jgi:hypothetical protein